MKKYLALLLAMVMVFALAACGGGDEKASQPTDAPASDAPATDVPATVAPGDGSYTVGICQLVQHPALDAATQGFMDALEEALPGRVTFDNQNASNDIPMCSTIVNQFVADNVDLMLCNATPALQAAAAATVDIPILGTSVTEYGVALELTDFTGTVGGNISGTSDLAPLNEQAQMIKDWCPEAKTVGLVYCSAEANSQYQVDVVKAELEKLGYTAELYSFSDSNDLAAVVESAVAASDVLYIPTDNTAAANTGIVDNICRPAKKPVFVGEEGICKGCGVATLSISYYELGRTTGEMAVKILTGEADVSAMPIEYYPNPVKEYNPDIASALGVTIPEGYTAIEG